ncbi:hypothetical protein NX059_001781 [Plenodomus lindquistii]|nr:hypothetical protein NX059_001781 [Plenodomus lindquistii]
MDSMPLFDSFVNPQDLENTPEFHDASWPARFDQYAPLQPSDAGATSDRSGRSQDSAVDLSTFTTFNYPKQDDDFNTFFNADYSTTTSNTPSPPSNDIVFSTANSPGDFRGDYRDQSQTSSPETSNDSLGNDTWAAIHIPQTMDYQPKVSINLDRTKTRAETQIKTVLVVDPLPANIQWVRFPRPTLSKSKQLASPEEIESNEKKDGTARVKLTLVLATAVEKPEGLERAYRRARGAEPTPRRPNTTPVTEIDKSDRCHPQNGGAVVICEGCKEREAKRYNRKKKRNAEEESEWNGYEDERIIMINEKEFKRWQDMDEDLEHTMEAKKVEFVMRITCYCRHQEDKSPVGYRVIFTFTDANDNLIAQEMSDIIQITDDHKNKENPAETLGPLTIPTGVQESLPTNYTVPMYDYSPTVYSAYSQPTTPIVPHTPGLTHGLPHSQSMFFPREAQYPRMPNAGMASQMPQQNGMGFPNGLPKAPTPQYATHQRGQSYFMPTMMSPKADMAAQVGYPLQRPQSLDSFAQWNYQYSPQASYSQQIYTSQPPSRATSRPASPTWDQGRGAKKMRGQQFMFPEDDFEE